MSVNLFPTEENDFLDLVMIVLDHLKDKKEKGEYTCPLGTHKQFYATRKLVFDRLIEHYQETFEEVRKDTLNLKVKPLKYIEVNGEYVLHFCYEIF